MPDATLMKVFVVRGFIPDGCAAAPLHLEALGLLCRPSGINPLTTGIRLNQD
jgi:hypothetical protein